jgi:hypothetical protein
MAFVVWASPSFRKSSGIGTPRGEEAGSVGRTVEVAYVGVRVRSYGWAGGTDRGFAHLAELGRYV